MKSEKGEEKKKGNSSKNKSGSLIQKPTKVINPSNLSFLLFNLEQS